MIERLTDLPAGFDGLRAKGKITREDYDSVLQPLLDNARSQGRRIRFLYHVGPEFEGFTAGGAWEDASSPSVPVRPPAITTTSQERILVISRPISPLPV